MTSGSRKVAEKERHGDGLTPGFYILTLVLAFISTTEIRVRVAESPSFTLLELGIYPASACFIAEMLLRPRLVERLRQLYWRNRAIAWYAGYAALATLIGLVRSPDTLKIFKDLFPALVLYVLVYLTADSHGRVLGLLAACLAGALLSVGLGLSQIAFGGPYVAELSMHLEAKQDIAGNAIDQVPTGIFGHPNALGALLLPVAIFLICSTWPGYRSSRRLGLGSLAILTVTLFVLQMSFVKGVYTWLAAAIVFLAIPRWLDRWRFPIAMVTPFVGIIALTWLSIHTFMEGDMMLSTMISRIELWLGAIDIISSDDFVLVFGNGSALMGARDFATMDYGNAHNAWIDQVLNYGLPALGLYLACFFVALRSLGQALVGATIPQRALVLATMSSVMALLGENFFEPVDRGVVFQAQLFILFALASIWRPIPLAHKGCA